MSSVFLTPISVISRALPGGLPRVFAQVSGP
jgi:hypothetical protein